MEALAQAFIVVTGISGQYFVANKNHVGFYFWIATNIGVVAVSLSHSLWGMAGLNFFYLCMCIWSVRKWKANP